MKRTSTLFVFIFISLCLLAQKTQLKYSFEPDTVVTIHDTIRNEKSVVIDSLLLNELLGDTISIDSVNCDSVMIDSADSKKMDLPHSIVVDSVVIDSLVVDSVIMDSLVIHNNRADTVVTNKKDSIIKPCKVRKKVVVPRSVIELRRLYSDYRLYLDWAQDRWDDIYLSLSDITMKPDYYKLVVPLTYYSASINQVSNIDSWYPKDILTEDSVRKSKILLEGLPCVDTSVYIDRGINRQLLNFYVDYPQLVKYNESRLDSIGGISFDELNYLNNNNKNEIISFVQNNAGFGQMKESDILVLKPNFWTSGGSGFLQFSQNYISDNWYKGGESTKSLLSGFTWQVKYDDKQKLQYEGKFEWKLGFITAPSDTVHSYKANNDLFRISSKLGFKAITNWYYTLSTEFQTQLFSNYATNSDKLISAFFSPATLNIGLGMDYKFIKSGKVDLSVLLNPFNYTLYSVASDEVDPTKFNIKKDNKTEHEFGSRINSTLTWKIIPSLLWESKFSYTTNYEKVFSEWENTFTFIVNKYLSTKLFVHARYDDGVKPKEGEGYLQLQQLLSFGVNYTW